MIIKYSLPVLSTLQFLATPAENHDTTGTCTIAGIGPEMLRLRCRIFL